MPPSPRRSAATALGSALARRPPALVVLLVACLLEVVALMLLGFYTNHHDIIGVTGAVAVLIAVVAAVASGPLVGLVVAVVGGVSFFVFISDLGETAPRAATVVSVVVWVVSAVIAGVVADLLREQQQARRMAQREASLLHEQLEAGLLPRLEPRVGPLRVVWRYLPSEDRLGVSGDFYDVTIAPDGRPALVIGDVIGHGPAAAALGATLRAGWYSLIRSGAPVDQVVETLADSVQRPQAGPDVFATMLLAWFAADAASVTFVRLGHPLPLLVGAGGIEQVEIAGAPPLGVGDAGEWAAVTVGLPPGWRLMLYTDGLIEGRSSPGASERFGLRRLLERLGARDGDGFGEPALDALLEEVTTANGGPLPDDVAVLVLCRAGQEGPDS